MYLSRCSESFLMCMQRPRKLVCFCFANLDDGRTASLCHGCSPFSVTPALCSSHFQQSCTPLHPQQVIAAGNAYLYACAHPLPLPCCWCRQSMHTSLCWAASLPIMLGGAAGGCGPAGHRLQPLPGRHGLPALAACIKRYTPGKVAVVRVEAGTNDRRAALLIAREAEALRRAFKARMPRRSAMPHAMPHAMLQCSWRHGWGPVEIGRITA
jgi:hypothetical protein